MNAELLGQVEKALEKCIVDSMSSYNSPLNLAVKDALSDHKDQLHLMASESVSELVNSYDFKDLMQSEIKRKLAKVLISQYGGEIEKTVAKLKQDPTSRAKMTLAIDNVMDELILGRNK
tara:strand:+ start:2238 stop:2594 length:357 start_codon:yes stop_codon:yes gene_type:complete